MEILHSFCQPRYSVSVKKSVNLRCVNGKIAHQFSHVCSLKIVNCTLFAEPFQIRTQHGKPARPHRCVDARQAHAKEHCKNLGRGAGSEVLWVGFESCLKGSLRFALMQKIQPLCVSLLSLTCKKQHPRRQKPRVSLSSNQQHHPVCRLAQLMSQKNMPYLQTGLCCPHPQSPALF